MPSTQLMYFSTLVLNFLIIITHLYFCYPAIGRRARNLSFVAKSACLILSPVLWRDQYCKCYFLCFKVLFLLKTLPSLLWKCFSQFLENFLWSCLIISFSISASAIPWLNIFGFFIFSQFFTGCSSHRILESALKVLKAQA